MQPTHELFNIHPINSAIKTICIGPITALLFWNHFPAPHLSLPILPHHPRKFNCISLLTGHVNSFSIADARNGSKQQHNCEHLQQLEQETRLQRQ